MRSVNGINQDILYHFAIFFVYISIMLHFGIFFDIIIADKAEGYSDLNIKKSIQLKKNILMSTRRLRHE